jgi:small subunit ribosomal protein S6
MVRRPVLPPYELSSLSGLEGLRARTADRLIEGKGTTMSLYEHVVLARQDLSAQQVEEFASQLKSVIEQMGGKVTKSEQWGVKSLAYRLRKNRKAHFTFMNLDVSPAIVNEIERQERLNEDVLRYLTIRVEEHEQGPSAMMRKADRDRDERGGGFRDRDRGDRDRGGFRDRGEHRRDREPRAPRDEPEASAPADATEE